jgi:hypothetical protein
MPVDSPANNPVGKKAFQYELKSRGVDGFIKWQDGISEDKARSQKRDFENKTDAQTKEFCWDSMPKFGYSHIPDERWPFPKKEIAHGR